MRVTIDYTRNYFVMKFFLLFIYCTYLSAVQFSQNVHFAAQKPKLPLCSPMFLAQPKLNYVFCPSRQEYIVVNNEAIIAIS